MPDLKVRITHVGEAKNIEIESSLAVWVLITVIVIAWAVR